MIDLTTCNVHATRGCRDVAPTTPIGTAVLELAADPSLRTLSAELGTLYVSNQLSDTVSVIDVHACFAEHPVGCRRSWPTVKVGAGCGRTPPEITVPGGAYTLVVDPSTHTVYVAEVDDGTASVIDGSTCNAQSHSGCKQTPTAVPVGDPSGLVLDQATRTLFVADRTNGVVSVLDADTATGGTPAAAPSSPPPRWEQRRGSWPWTTEPAPCTSPIGTRTRCRWWTWRRAVHSHQLAAAGRHRPCR